MTIEELKKELIVTFTFLRYQAAKLVEEIPNHQSFITRNVRNRVNFLSANKEDVYRFLKDKLDTCDTSIKALYLSDEHSIKSQADGSLDILVHLLTSLETFFSKKKVLSLKEQCEYWEKKCNELKFIEKDGEISFVGFDVYLKSTEESLIFEKEQNAWVQYSIYEELVYKNGLLQEEIEASRATIRELRRELGAAKVYERHGFLGSSSSSSVDDLPGENIEEGVVRTIGTSLAPKDPKRGFSTRLAARAAARAAEHRVKNRAVVMDFAEALYALLRLPSRVSIPEGKQKASIDFLPDDEADNTERAVVVYSEKQFHMK